MVNMQNPYARRQKKYVISSWYIKLKLKHLFRKQEDPVLLAESDADWSGDQNDGKSTTGFYVQYGQHSGAISCQVSKQQTVALSSCKS